MKSTKPRDLLAVIFLFLLAVVFAAACGGTSNGDVAACKAAMKADYANALANPSASPASKPAACNGLSDDQITKIAEQIMSGQ